MPGTLLLLAPIVLPLAAAAGYATGGRRPRAARIGLASSVLLLIAAAALAAKVTTGGALNAWDGLLRADALSAWMLLVVAAVALLTAWSAPTHPVRTETRWYGILLHLFVATMVTAVLAGSLGVLWVAVEATTIVTAFLVGHYRTRGALEAAWKYVVICSAAIAIAFLGTVLIYYAARHAGKDATAALLLHMAGHGLAKSVAFLSAGHVLHQERTSRISQVRALAARSPVLAAGFGLAVLALLGLPPAAVFASEVGIARAGAQAGLGAATIAAYALVLVAAAAMITHTARMLLGPRGEATPAPTGAVPAPRTAGSQPAAAGEPASRAAVGDVATREAAPPVAEAAPSDAAPPKFRTSAAAPLIAGLIAVGLLGVTTWPLTDLLATAADLLGAP